MFRILMSVFVLVTIASPAYAYIDVGIGSMILQALIAGFVTFLVMWRSFTMKLKNFFRGKGFQLDTEDTPQTTAEE